METRTVWRQLDTAQQSTTPANGGRYALKVVLVYQDDQTRQWAGEVCTRVEQLGGGDSIRPTWLNLWNLNQPAVLAGAVFKAMQSDMIVVAVRAAAELPLAFYNWADMWLANRSGGRGTLVALIGLPKQPNGETHDKRELLRALSRRGRLDFAVEERRLPEASDGLEQEQKRSLGAATAAAPQKICICCGEGISEAGRDFSRNPNLCPSCSSLWDGMDEEGLGRRLKMMVAPGKL